MVSYLTEELVRQGHQVTLFASGDSLTEAELVPVCEQSLRLAPGCVDTLAHHVMLVERWWGLGIAALVTLMISICWLWPQRTLGQIET